MDIPRKLFYKEKYQENCITEEKYQENCFTKKRDKKIV